jgi:hypothetical protein
MNKLQNLLLAGGLFLGASLSARAEGTFDETAVVTKFTSISTTAAAIVGTLAALGASIMIYRKIKGYTSKVS